tara:strand:+ start:376 stop:555 length:180 start_codon:yes stop_codon:yes gene_type:complete
VGSIPITRSILVLEELARIAQSVERIHGKDEVISSILIAGSIFDFDWAGSTLPVFDFNN